MYSDQVTWYKNSDMIYIYCIYINTIYITHTYTAYQRKQDMVEWHDMSPNVWKRMLFWRYFC